MKRIKLKSGAYEKVHDDQDKTEKDSVDKNKDKKKESDFTQKELNELTVILARRQGLIE